MKVTVMNQDAEYHAQADSGMELRILFGEGKPAEDTTMNPVELFASALGMCIAAMLRKYCIEHDLDAGPVTVDLESDWKPGKPSCEDLRVQVNVEGDWDRRRKAAFLKVAETCPVHQTIANCSSLSIDIV
ncbi:MAG: OsmC family protein [Armatimonadota bacterium]